MRQFGFLLLQFQDLPEWLVLLAQDACQAKIGDFQTLIRRMETSNHQPTAVCVDAFDLRADELWNLTLPAVVSEEDRKAFYQSLATMALTLAVTCDDTTPPECFAFLVAALFHVRPMINKLCERADWAYRFAIFGASMSFSR